LFSFSTESSEQQKFKNCGIQQLLQRFSKSFFAVISQKKRVGTPVLRKHFKTWFKANCRLSKFIVALRPFFLEVNLFEQMDLPFFISQLQDISMVVVVVVVVVVVKMVVSPFVRLSIYLAK
jgi:hypothetical protein